MRISSAVVLKDITKAKNKQMIRTIYLRVTINGKQVYLDTGYKCAIKDFYNKNNQVIKSGVAYSSQINSALQHKINELNTQIQRSIARTGSVDLEFVQSVWTGKFGSDLKATLLEALQDWIHERKLSSNSISLYTTSVNSFMKFCEESEFQQISVQAINDYTRSSGYKEQYFRILKILFRSLEKRGVLAKFTLEQIHDIRPEKAKKKKTKVALTQSEVDKFYGYWKQDDGDHTKRMVIGSFVFSCETGLRFSDLTTLCDNDFKTTDQITYIEKIAQKTKTEFAVPLSERALEIYQCYRKEGIYFDFFRQYVHDTNRSKEYRKLLQKVAKELLMTKHLTAHVGRHTFITLLAQQGCNLANLQSMVGHADYKMTEKYKSIDKSAAFRDFFATKSSSGIATDLSYHIALRNLSSKKARSGVTDAELNGILIQNGISDDVSDYFAGKKTMGVGAYYVLNKCLSGILAKLLKSGSKI